MSSESRDQQSPPGASCSWQSAWAAGGQQSQEQSGQPIMQQGSSYDKQVKMVVLLAKYAEFVM